MLLIRADREDHPICFSADYQYAIAASRGGALGMMIAYRYPVSTEMCRLTHRTATMIQLLYFQPHSEPILVALNYIFRKYLAI